MKESFVAKLEAQLENWETSLDELKAKAGGKLHLEDWRAQKAAALSKLEQLRTESGDRWDAMKMGVESAWDELRAAFETATAKPARDPGAESKPGVRTPDRKAS